MSESERRVDDPRINDHERRLNDHDRRLSVSETKLEQMAPKVEVLGYVKDLSEGQLKLTTAIERHEERMEIRFTDLAKDVGKLVETTDRQAQINNENMVKESKKADEKHLAEMATLKQQLEDSKPLNKIKIAAVYLGFITALGSVGALIGGAILWWITNQLRLHP